MYAHQRFCLLCFGFGLKYSGIIIWKSSTNARFSTSMSADQVQIRHDYTVPWICNRYPTIMPQTYCARNILRQHTTPTAHLRNAFMYDGPLIFKKLFGGDQHAGIVFTLVSGVVPASIGGWEKRLFELYVGLFGLTMIIQRMSSDWLMANGWWSYVYSTNGYLIHAINIVYDISSIHY